MTPQVVDAGDAAVKQVVLRGDSIDIRRLPIVHHFEADLSPVITMAAVMKDRYRHLRRLVRQGLPEGAGHGPRVDHTQHLERILAKYEKRGEPAPYVHILGHIRDSTSARWP